MFIHPLFQGTDEGTELDKFAAALGFDSDFVLLDTDDLSEKQRHDYQHDSSAFLDAWKPNGPEGYTLAATFDTDRDPIAFFVKPTSEFAEQLLNLSATELRRQLQEQAA